MARRGKTVIKSGPDQQNMMRALEQGEAAVHRSSEALRQQQNIDYQDRRQLAMDIGQGVGAGQQYMENKERQRLADEAATEKEKYERGITKKKMQLERETATSKAAQSERALNLKAAEAGRQAPPSRDPLLARQQQVDGEMQQGTGAQQPQGQPPAGQQDPGAAPTMPQSGVDAGPPPEDPAERGRQHIQMDKPLGDHPYALSEEGRQARAHEQRMDIHKADMDRAAEISKRTRAVGAFEKGLLDMDRPEQHRAREELQKSLRTLTGALDNVQNDEALTKEQLKKILGDSEGHPVQEIIRRYNRYPTPEDQKQVAAFLKNNRGRAAVDFIGDTGEMPDSPLIDLDNPQLQLFFGNVGYVVSRITGLKFGGWLGIKSSEEKARLLNKIAAALTKRNLSTPMGMGGGGGEQQPGMTNIAGADPAMDQPSGPPQTGMFPNVAGAGGAMQP